MRVQKPFILIILLSIVSLTQTGKKEKLAAFAAKQQKNQQDYLNQLQASCPPGYKLFTCLYCKKICMIPEAYPTISCVMSYGQHTPSHPGSFNG